MKITIEQLIGDKTDVINFEAKKKNLEMILETIIDPLEKSGYNLKVVRGLQRPSEISDIDTHYLRSDYILGTGVDLTSGNKDTDKEIVEKLREDGLSSVTLSEGYFHIHKDLEM